MADEARAILSTLSVRRLRELAKAHGVDVAGCTSKADHVTALAGSEALRATLDAPGFRVRPQLAAKGLPALRTLAAELGVAVGRVRNKADLVDRIAASPAVSRLLEPPPASVVAAPGKSDPSDAVDPLLLKGRHVDVDFGLAEDVLDQARMRFEEHAFDRALELAHEALLLARGTLDAFEQAGWAYAILSSQHLIEESRRAGRNVKAAETLLRDAKVACASGNLSANHALLVRLRGATKALYSEELQRLRTAMYAAQDTIDQVTHFGGDFASAQEALMRAREAMERADHPRALNLLSEVERLASEARERRVEEIRVAIPAITRMIEEARHLGAEVGEASNLLEKAKVALERREYVLAAELIQRAERSALERQHDQVRRVLDLRLRQVERARGTVNRLLPILDEAAGFGLDVAELRRVVADARRVIEHGDYVNGTSLARQAEAAVIGLVPLLVAERANRGIAKPVAGRCPMCNAEDVAILDDGWSECRACRASWRWRVSPGLWERLLTVLRA